MNEGFWHGPRERSGRLPCMTTTFSLGQIGEIGLRQQYHCWVRADFREAAFRQLRHGDMVSILLRYTVI
jgi:hypothetical protein